MREPDIVVPHIVLPKTIMEMMTKLEVTLKYIKAPLVLPEGSNLGLIQSQIQLPICRKFIKKQRNMLNCTKGIKSAKRRLWETRQVKQPQLFNKNVRK